MDSLTAKIIGGLVTLLTGLIGGSGGVLWYLDRRAEEEHEAEQAEIDRAMDRIIRLEKVNAELRKDLEGLRSEIRSQSEQMIEQGQVISELRQEVAQAELEKAAKDGEITRLQAHISALETRLQRLEASDPHISEVQSMPAAAAEQSDNGDGTEGAS